MGRIKEQPAAYKINPKRKRGSGTAKGRREYVLDAKGNRVGIILDIPTYEKLMEALEELEDIRDFDEHTKKAEAEFKRKDYVTLDEYKRERKAAGR
jgi:hypothetical protein